MARGRKPANPAVEAAPAPAPAEATVTKRGRTSTLETANGVSKPGGGTTRQIWDMADNISKKSKRPATRAEVLAEAEKAGLNASTAATQFGRWQKFYRKPEAA